MSSHLRRRRERYNHCCFSPLSFCNLARPLDALILTLMGRLIDPEQVEKFRPVVETCRNLCCNALLNIAVSLVSEVCTYVLSARCVRMLCV